MTAGGDLDYAVAGQAVTLTLAGEIGASRGDVIAEVGASEPLTNRLGARLVWMGETADRRQALSIETRCVHCHRGFRAKSVRL